jgi:hypothetical protein
MSIKVIVLLLSSAKESRSVIRFLENTWLRVPCHGVRSPGDSLLELDCSLLKKPHRNPWNFDSKFLRVPIGWYDGFSSYDIDHKAV